MVDKANNTLRSFHIVLTDASEDDKKATGDPRVVDGALVLSDNRGVVAIYAPGTWTFCEPERKDE